MANSNAVQKMQDIADSMKPSKEAHLEALGKFDDTVFHSQVLVMTYIRNSRTTGGIIIPGKSLEEDRFQGKIGLVVAMGKGAFKDDNIAKFHGDALNIHDWVLYRPADGTELFYNGCSLRLFQDVNILARVGDPKKYW